MDSRLSDVSNIIINDNNISKPEVKLERESKICLFNNDGSEYYLWIIVIVKKFLYIEKIIILVYRK